MAVVNECRKISHAAGTLAARYADEHVREEYDIRLATGTSDLPDILVSAGSPLAGIALPQRYEAWPTSPSYGLYAKEFQFAPNNDDRTWYRCSVNFMPLEPGEAIKDDNPLSWPPEFRVDYIEEEFQVQEAYNIEEFTGDAGRLSGTFGPVVNTAFEQLSEPLMDVDRHPVLKIKRNVASLDVVIDFNSFYNLTTNTDVFFGATERQAKFLVAEGGDQQFLNGVSFVEMIASVSIQKTTDRPVDNVGWKHFNADAGQPNPFNPGENIGWTKVIAKVLDEDTDELVPSSEPVNLDLAGKKTSEPQKITYRYLDAVQYSNLVSGLPPGP